MNKNEILVALLVAVYITGSIVTFGYAYNHDYKEPEVLQNGVRLPDRNAPDAAMSAMLWPFYLSRVAFEGVRK